MSEPRGPAQIRPHSWHLLIILLSVVPDWARGRGMSARRKRRGQHSAASFLSCSHREEPSLPRSRQLRLATPRPAPPPARPRSLAAGKPGAPSCILGNVVPCFHLVAGPRRRAETVHSVWAMSPQRLRPPFPFGWTDRTPQRVTSFIGTCTVLWPRSREACLAALVGSVCCRVRSWTLHRGCAGARARDGDDQAGC